jgi:hypothetical protein
VLIAGLFQSFVIFVAFCKNIFFTEGNKGNEGASRYAFDFGILVKGG